MSVTLADMEVTMRMRLPAIELAVILLPLPPECQHYRHKLPHLVRVGALEDAEQACLRSNGETGVGVGVGGAGVELGLGWGVGLGPGYFYHESPT